LIKAAKKFDESMKVKFITYAVWWIRQAVLKALAGQSRICKIPLNRISQIHNVGKSIGKFEQKYHRSPSVEEIGYIFDMKRYDAVLAYELGQAHVSLSQPVRSKNDDVRLEDSLYDEDAPPTDFKAEQNNVYIYLNSVIDSLGDKKQSKAIKMYFGINKDHTPYTLEEIGEKFGVSRKMARQIKEKALRRLRSPAFSNKLRSALQKAAA
jgi:RNA polymerase primary sigma factor